MVDKTGLLELAADPDNSLFCVYEPGALQDVGGDHTDVVNAPKELPPGQFSPVFAVEGYLELIAELDMRGFGPGSDG